MEEALHFYKFKVFKIGAQRYSIKAILMPKLIFFCFTWNYGFWEIWEDWLKFLKQQFFKITAQNNPNKAF